MAVFDPAGIIRPPNCGKSANYESHLRSSTIRPFCFLYSLLLFNAWILANAELTCNPRMLGGTYSRITQTDMKVIILVAVLSWYMERRRPPDLPVPVPAFPAPCLTPGQAKAS